MKNTTAFWLFLIILFLIGCATTEKYKAVLNTWVGSHINEMMDSWGYPSGSFKAPNGNTVYVYSDSGVITTPTYARTTGDLFPGSPEDLGLHRTTVTGGEAINLSCTTYIETNTEGIIVHWSFKGNNCVSD